VYKLNDGGALASDLGAFVRPHMVGAPPFRWADAVVRTEQMTPMGWHFDRDYAAPWRVLVYLSSLGGTEFESSLIAGGNPGDVVMFDIRLRHRSPACRGLRGCSGRGGTFFRRPIVARTSTGRRHQ
jgi:hypothetical protein